jgi:cytochrome c oxidase accessory protein FixG
MNAPESKVRLARMEFYRKKGKVHAREVKGRFNTLRWSLVILTQLVFFGACWLGWDGRQALWFDIPEEKFYIFGAVLWPQDALLLAIVMILAALGLFWVTAIAGRVFCGYACPQTVYTSIFTWIEARVEGDHLARLKLDQGPNTPRKLALKATKHGLWLGLSLWSGLTFVGYFTPIRELLPAFARWDLGPWEAFWVLFYAGFMYLQAGFAREMVCQHMCPYSRFQGVMFDSNTRTVAYDLGRGEPRNRHQKDGAPKGDCVDCSICVQVCPTGIDIRDGLQYQCINCGLCVDACDGVMDKVGKPRGLIRYASEQELAGRSTAGHAARLRVYGALVAVFVGLGVWTIVQRPALRVDVLRDRGSLAREATDGLIENAYTLKLANLADAPREFDIQVSGLPGAQLRGNTRVTGEPGQIRTVQVTVAVPPDAAGQGVRPIAFDVVAQEDPGTRAHEKTTFVLP